MTVVVVVMMMMMMMVMDIPHKIMETTGVTRKFLH
jgi:hypothetical protein